MNALSPLLLSLPAVPISIGMARGGVADLATEAGAPDGVVAGIRLAVSEAVTNAVRHAYDDGAREGEVRVSAEVERTDVGPTLVVVVADDGPGLRPRPDSPGLGLGLPLMAHATVALDIVDGQPGARVCMRFALR